MALTTVPTNYLKSFPPFGYASKVKVGNSDSWELLGLIHGRPPMEIIQFNFETTVFTEINWYMYKYIGCRKEKDGKNYSFSDTDDPGYVYIPPESWKPGTLIAKAPVVGENATARRAVLDTLSYEALSRVQFPYAGRNISRSSFIGVANSIIDNRIRVAVNTSLGDHAEYGHAEDCLFLPWETAGAYTRKALIVHEAVHAALDRGRSDCLVYQSEAAAYLAQMMFMLTSTGTGLTGGPTGQVYFVAYTVAEALLAGKKMSELSLEMFALEKAVQQHPWYMADAFKTAGYNGI